MFKYGSSTETELMQSMEKELVANQVETKHGFNKLAKALDCISAAADIFDKSGLYEEANDITKLLKSFAEWEDEIDGGLADKKKPEDFDKEQLNAGIKIEMEHTNNKLLATEIAMDHLTEDPSYYKKLKTIETH